MPRKYDPSIESEALRLAKDFAANCVLSGGIVYGRTYDNLVAELRRLTGVEAEVQQTRAELKLSEQAEQHWKDNEISDLQRDAGRYRWLRTCGDLDVVVQVVKEPGRWETPYLVILQNEDLDAAIDAAKGESNK